MTISIKDAGLALTFAAALALPSMGLAQDAGGAPDDGAAAMAEGLMAMDGTAEAGTEAPTGWHDCDVVRSGAGWGNHYVALTCTTGPFTNKWHILSAAQKDAMLATALAAASSDNRVQVYIQGPTSGYNTIGAMYLLK